METNIYELYNTLLKKSLIQLDELLAIASNLSKKHFNIRDFMVLIDTEMKRAESCKWSNSIVIPQEIKDLKDYVLGKAYLISTNKTLWK